MPARALSHLSISEPVCHSSKMVTSFAFVLKCILVSVLVFFSGVCVKNGFAKSNGKKTGHAHAQVPILIATIGFSGLQVGKVHLVFSGTAAATATAYTYKTWIFASGYNIDTTQTDAKCGCQ